VGDQFDLEKPGWELAVSRDTRAKGQREGRGKREEEMGGDAPPVVYLLDPLQPVDWTGLARLDTPGTEGEREGREGRFSATSTGQGSTVQCSPVQWEFAGSKKQSLSRGQSRARIGREFSTRAGRQAGWLCGEGGVELVCLFSTLFWV
jgi:hypothetical protein